MVDWIKSNKVLTILVILLLGASFYGIFKEFRQERPQEHNRIHKVDKQKGEKMKEETTDEKNYREAKLKLEHPYSPVDNEIKDSVLPITVEALDTIKGSKKVTDVKGTYENHLSMTENPMIQTAAIAFLINHYNYQVNKIEILKSNSEDVVQILIPLTKDNADSVYFVGNYNLTVKQLQISDYVGGPIGATFG